MSHHIPATILDATTEEVSRLAIEYGQLSTLPALSEAQEERLQEIVDRACDDGALSFWIGELDHLLGHQMELLTLEHRQSYDNQKAVLKERLVEFVEGATAGKSPAEIRQFMAEYLAQRSRQVASGSVAMDRPQYSGH